jgi:hypothetical protein
VRKDLLLKTNVAAFHSEKLLQTTTGNCYQLICTRRELVFLKFRDGDELSADYSDFEKWVKRLDGSFDIQSSQIVDARVDKSGFWAWDCPYIRVLYENDWKQKACSFILLVGDKLNTERRSEPYDRVVDVILGLKDAKRVVQPQKLFTDARVVEVATKYAGILTLSVVVLELKASLEQAHSLLERFVSYGEARKVQMGPLTLYDFPAARGQLGDLQNQIIDVMLKSPRPIGRPNLISTTRVSIEALDEALADLQRKGILSRDIDGCYQLRVARSEDE